MSLLRAETLQFSRLLDGRRLELFMAQGGKCFYCSRAMLTARNEPDVVAGFRDLFCTVDHVLPRARGGIREHGVVAACARCNVAKDKMTGAEFLVSPYFQQLKSKAA